MRPNPGWRQLEHTADLRMEFSGRTREELFLNAALGLTSVLAPESSREGLERIEVKLEGDDLEELLVNWLREILFLNQVRGFVMTGARLVTLSESALKAVLRGKTLDEGESPEIEIKAVTYHGMSVKVGDKGYTATVIFDV